MGNVISFVLGGGRGTRLYPLTKYRAKPAVPLAGKYRLIDIPLSNCLNSGLNRIYVLTQFLSVSLHRHIRQTYRFDHFSGGFVELLAAQQTMDEGTDWYQGTADAVRKNVRYLQQPGMDYVLILSGDQLYRMDFRKMIETHEQAKADVTIAALPVSSAAASGLGIMRADESGRVIGFVEKPKTEEQLKTVHLDAKWMEKRGVQAAWPRLPGQHGDLPVQPRSAGRIDDQDPIPGLRQGGLSAVHQHAARSGPPVRRLLGRHRNDQGVLRRELEPGAPESAVTI